MAYMCTKGFGECDGCGRCDSWDEDVDREDEEYRPEDDWNEE